MRASEVSDKVVRQIVWNYVNYPQYTMEKLGKRYNVTRNFVSKLLHRAIEENIVSDTAARMIVERATENSDSKVGEAGASMVRKAYERSLEIREQRKKAIENSQNADIFSKADASLNDNSNAGQKYVEPKSEQLSMFSLL